MAPEALEHHHSTRSLITTVQRGAAAAQHHNLAHSQGVDLAFSLLCWSYSAAPCTWDPELCKLCKVSFPRGTRKGSAAHCLPLVAAYPGLWAGPWVY